MQVKQKIISHEFVNEDYLRLNIVFGNLPCGTIDLIAEKINFNVTGKYFFKGMEAINNIQLELKEGELVFTFRNKKRLSFHCDQAVFTTVNTYMKAFQEQAMKIIKIHQSFVEVQFEVAVLRITGEAMMPKQLPELTEYILYKNTLSWINTDVHPDMDSEVLFSFLRKEFLKQNLHIIIE